MGKTIFIATLALLSCTGEPHAGSFANGAWTPSNCGSQPETPTIEDSSGEAYNNSLKGLKTWQAKAQTYVNCLINEANADSQAIAASANAEQERFGAAVSGLNAATAAAKAKLDKK
jgi:hypothetical protein